MSRSRNSRKGSTNKHTKRHGGCGPGCSYCQSNYTIATLRQKAKNTET